MAGPVARVNGDLAVSRGFGDAEYKKTGGPGPEDRPVTADPELGNFECAAGDFLLLVCDGVSEGDFSNAEVVQLVANRLKEGDDLPAVAEAAAAVCHKAVETGSKDNITCMIVLFDGGEELEMQKQFNPGCVTHLDNKQIMSAYTSMAEKAGYTLAQAVELRYDLLKAKLERAEELPEGEKAQAEEELEKIGAPEGDKGSEERKNWFEKWATQTPETLDHDPAYRTDAQRVIDRVRQMGLGMFQGNETKRKVKTAALEALKADVDAHPALKWDERMTEMAGEEGLVLKDDNEDSTSQVQFERLGIVAWLPMSTISDTE